MTESDMVRVPFGDSGADTAALLLDAAEKSEDHDAGSVTVRTDGTEFVFEVPKALADDAGVDYDDVEDDSVEAETVDAGPPKPAKKTARKRAAKKTAK